MESFVQAIVYSFEIPSAPDLGKRMLFIVHTSVPKARVKCLQYSILPRRFTRRCAHGGPLHNGAKLSIVSHCSWYPSVSWLIAPFQQFVGSIQLDQRRYIGNVNTLLNVNRSCLHAGHKTLVIELLKRGADVNRICSIPEEHQENDESLRDANGGTALIGAASSGHEKIVKALLVYGADMDVATPNGGKW